MALTPAKRSLVVLEQGGKHFKQLSAWNDAVKLSAGTAVNYDVSVHTPCFMSLSYQDNGAYMLATDASTTATIPAAGITNGSGPEWSPTNIFVDSGFARLSFISPYSTTITLSINKA